LFSAPLNQNENFARTVLEAQAKFTLVSSKTILAANLVAAATAIGLMIPLRGNLDGLLPWLATLGLFTVLRFLVAKLLLKKQYAAMKPQDAINVMSAMAFLQGLSWGLLPVAFMKMDLLGNDAPIMLVLAGLVGTAFLRHSFVSQTAFSYCVPILLACAWCFVRHGGIVAIVSTLDLILVSSFLIYLMTKAERRTIDGEVAKLKSEFSAKSLIKANEDIRRNNVRLEILANCDPVTGLYNRIYLNGNIAGALASATVSGRKIALLLFDVDRFKRINDAFGHHGGDQFLTILGQRLKAAAGPNAITARISGDEFAVLIPHGDVRKDGIALARTMVEYDQAPITINGSPVTPCLSAGLAFFPSSGQNANEIFSSAIMALAEAKQAGKKQWREFDPKFRQSIHRQRQIEQDLHEALDNEQITPWFQPQIDLKSGRVVSFEALVRWLHPTLGPIAPPDIINAAQVMNLNQALTRLIANHVCNLLKDLPPDDFADATVALNISPREFAIYDVAQMLNDVTALHGVKSSRVEIEITEETIVDPDIAGEQLQQMQANGYRLAVDDFGIGYSSLAYLISLKIDRLKIDRSIVTGIGTSSTNQALVGAMLGFGRAVGVEIVVEGVESEEDAQTLTALGCDIAQGFYFARPMPSDVLLHWLEQIRQLDRQNRASA
jgi:diguanylate cyclase